MKCGNASATCDGNRASGFLTYAVSLAKNGLWRNRECKNSLTDLFLSYLTRYNRKIELKAVYDISLDLKTCFICSCDSHGINYQKLD